MPQHRLRTPVPNEPDPTKWRNLILSDDDPRDELSMGDTVTVNGVPYNVISSEAKTNPDGSLRVFAYHVQPNEPS